MGFLFVLIVGLLAGTISGIVGTGSSIMLMPVLVYQYGPKEAVPIMAVAAVMANLSRILAWWREVDWRACLAYSVTGIPAAALGARTLLALPPHAVDIAIGLFLIAMVPVRHWLARHQLKAPLWHLAVGGAIIGYITGIVVSTGPLSVPLFLFYGLTKGAFLATEAASSLGLYFSKSMTFERFGALTGDVAIKGLIAGSSLMFGAFIAKRFVLRLEPDVFRLLMDGIMIAAGLAMLCKAFIGSPDSGATSGVNGLSVMANKRHSRFPARPIERTEVRQATLKFAEAALTESKREGLLLAVRARWVALAVTAVTLPIINPNWEVLYYVVMLGCLP